MSHYQIKRNEYGQICIRAPHHQDDQIQGFLFHQDGYGFRNPTGHFAQAVLFPAEMQEWHTHAEYRIADGLGGWLYYIGQLPSLTQTWQYIQYQQIQDHDPNWYLADEAPPHSYPWDLENLLIDHVPPPAPTPDPEFAAWLNDSLTKIIEDDRDWYTLDMMAGELGVTNVYLARVINMEAVAEDFFQENARALVARYLE